MRKIFYREKKEDPRLRLELVATSSSSRVDYSIVLRINSVMIYSHDDSPYVYCSVNAHRDVAESARNFFYKHNGQQNSQNEEMGIILRLRFDNDETYYELFWGAFLFDTETNSLTEVTLHSEVASNNARFIRNGVINSIDMNPNIRYDIEMNFDNIVAECMEMQRQNPPKPISPMEIMRRNAAKRFAGVQPVEDVYQKENKKETAQAEGNDDVFDESRLKIVEGSKDPEKELKKIIGMENIKHELFRMEASIELQKKRAQELNLSETDHSGHMCFMGPPGTGKTMIARLITGVLYKMGMIQKNQCIEISGLDLMGNYLGQTAQVTQKTVDYAKGGVLFIDEAYAITESQYGVEAVNVLLKEMEDNRSNLVVIFAGYEKDMNRLLGMNEGFRSRINRYFTFENYRVEDLSKIFMLNLRSRNLVITEDALLKSMKIFSSEVNAPTFSNGRFVRNFVEKIEDNHIVNRVGIEDTENLNLITTEDIPEEGEKWQ